MKKYKILIDPIIIEADSVEDAEQQFLSKMEEGDWSRTIHREDDPKIGPRVYWSDPDDALCSGYGRVVSIMDDVVTLEMDSGGEVECYLSELS